MGVDSEQRRSSYSRKRPKEETVQYALLIYGSGDGWEKLSPEEQQTLLAAVPLLQRLSGH